MHRIFGLSLLTMVSSAACAESPSDAGSDLGADASPSDPPDAGGMSEQPDARAPSHEVPCIDQSISALMLFDVPAGDAIQEERREGDSFETLIDATGGGLSPTTSFTYVRFTPEGIEQLAISDEDAFESTEWHLALRRYVLRVNSGVAGPADVSVARTAPMTDFAALDAAPEELTYRTEEYFTEGCDLIPDASGIGAPGTALSSFWSYAGCVAMTGNVYVLDLGDGAAVKLEVLAYYTPENQQICDETNAVPMPSGAGNVRIRWAFLD